MKTTIMVTIYTRSSFKDDTQQQKSENYGTLAQHHAKEYRAKKEKDFEDVIKQSKTFFGPHWGLKTFKKSLHPLAVMVCAIINS